MNHSRIALQLYTLRDFTRTPDDLARTLQRVREIGFPAVELAGSAGLGPSETAALVADAGLSICASHESPAEILGNTQAVIDRALALGVGFVVYPYPEGWDMSEHGVVERLAGALAEAGARMREAGLALCYHNHAAEFYRPGPVCVLEQIYASTAPADLLAELDIHWVQAGGGDPAAWCRKLAGRVPLLHVKDYSVSLSGERRFAEAGSGNLDIPGILRAAEASGCRWFIIEQDVCETDPFDCIARSLAYLSQLCDGA